MDLLLGGRSRSHLLNIPWDVRLIIYTYLLEERFAPGLTHQQRSRVDRMHTSLMLRWRTNKQL